jgi:glutamyl-tRNA reductase
MIRDLHAPLTIGGISHHDADIATLEAFRFPDEEALLLEARELFKGVVILQTCNRVEVIVEGDAATLDAFLKEKGRKGYRIREGMDALRHLLQLAAGMESMIVGEDQIIGQLKSSLSLSQELNTCSSVLDMAITKAVHVGIEVRKRTHINNGAVSIGSAAVQLAEQLLGDLAGKHILVVGSGEMGTLVTQALAAKHLTAIYVTNRTFARAVTLAQKIGGRAVYFNELYRYLSLSDVVICCTSAPHTVIHHDAVVESLEEQRWPLDQHPRPLIIIDIAQPRDVDDAVGTITGVHLFSIDDLRSVSASNLENRRKEAEQAQCYIEDELHQFVILLNRAAANDNLSILYTWAEAIRVRERDKATARLGTVDQRTEQIIDDLTKVLIKKLLVDATFSIRSSAECGELESAKALVQAITQGERLCFHKED